MDERSGAQQPDNRYIVACVGERLAEDARTSELGIDVTVVANQVFLHGAVATHERREAVGAVAREAAPGYEIHNEVSVIDLTEPDGRQELL